MVCKRSGERQAFNLPPPSENEWSVSSSYNPGRPVPAVQLATQSRSPMSSPKGRSRAASPPLSPGSGGARKREGLAEAVHEALVIPQQSVYSQSSFASTTSTLPPDYHQIEGEKVVIPCMAPCTLRHPLHHALSAGGRTESEADLVTSQAVWDIIAMIRNKNAEKKAEARRHTAVRQHCQMYDKTNSG